MKNTILITISAILGVLTWMIVMTVYGRINRSMELKSNLSAVVEETVENMTLNPKYKIQNTNEILADLTESLVLALDAQSDVSIKILGCDKEKGLLSMEVLLTYLHPNGKTGKVSCEKTVIVNQLALADEPERYKVTFYMGDTVYKEYSVAEGSVICEPKKPASLKGEFNGWLDAEGYLADFTQPVTQNIAFYAEVR